MIGIQAQNKKQNRFLKEGEFIINGFGQASTGLSFSTGQVSIDGCLAAAVTLNETYFLGGFYKDVLNTLDHPVTYEIRYGPNGENSLLTSDDGNVTYSFYGMQAGYWYQSNFPFHAGASFRYGWWQSSLFDPFGRNLFDESVQLIHPELLGYYKFNDWFKLNIALGYRWVTGFDAAPQYNLSSTNHNAPTFQLGFNFGWFKLK